ncbi:hypothetical protein POVWA2_004320 [Plasmodium ovale wallikeri]|uniref:Uncharacterized protein n=1 Tax=Plasmodium ovale wallikeri TaxID=864142 RepID=A0A1A8YHV0_PLAOA|nr:hypothetical protein POVWA1_004180 [Plasmodium ovale wallikeri]SBT31456.1 hypothetical protein POVWA2_004320 [Plasmodium ovale wallikeri]
MTRHANVYHDEGAALICYRCRYPLQFGGVTIYRCYICDTVISRLSSSFFAPRAYACVPKYVKKKKKKKISNDPPCLRKIDLPLRSRPTFPSAKFGIHAFFHIVLFPRGSSPISSSTVFP